MTYPQEVAFVLLDLVTDVLVEEQLTEDEGAHGLHIQTLCLRQDILLSAVDGSTFFLLLQHERSYIHCSQKVAIFRKLLNALELLQVTFMSNGSVLVLF